MRTRMRRIGVGLLTVVWMLGTLAVPAWAADLPAYDITPQRTRVITGTTPGITGTLFSDIPVYVQISPGGKIPPGSQSLSTPNVVGSTAYQYTFDSGGTGYLSAITLPNLSSSQVAQQAGSKGYVITAAQYAQPVITLAAGFTGSLNMAASQSSLSTGPYVNGNPDGTQYQAIGVGKELYTWSAAAYPTGGTPPAGVTIRGNLNNATFQVDSSPLITPPVTISGMDLNTGSTVSWQTPMAVVGSWDGGLVATPVYVPSGDMPNTPNLSYITSQPQANGTETYPHSAAAITSDPTWVGAVPGVGSHCVAFGIDGSHPRVVLFDVSTGAYQTIGVGTIAAGVADTVIYDATDHLIFVQDVYGAIYAFSLTGTLTFGYWPGSWTSSQEILGQDMALDQGLLYAVGGGGNLLGGFSATALNQNPLITNQFGPHVTAPGALNGPQGRTTVVMSNAQGSLWINGSNNLFVHGYVAGAQQPIATPTGSAYIGYQLDAGPNHDLLGWTDRDPAGNPALVIYVPTPYGMRADVSAATIASGQSIRITGLPNPIGVTAQSAGGPPGDPTGAPVDYAVTGPKGWSLNWQPMQWKSPGHWTAPWTPPPNASLQPEAYTITVEGWDAQGQMATATTHVTVDPGPPPARQTSSNQGALALTCGFGAGGLPITVPHTCTLPAWTTGNPASWFVHHPIYGAKFGDTIELSLTVPAPQLPAGYQITGEQLRAQVPYTEGIPNMPGPQGDAPTGQSLYDPSAGVLYWYRPNTVSLVPTGINRLTATGSLIESWDGYPPKEHAANSGDTTTLSANWRLTTFYQYWVSNPFPPGGGYWQSGQTITSGTATAPVTVNGTDYYEVATPMGY